MKVAFLVTCLADHYFAEAAADAVRLLRHLGCDVVFPEGQTCCGQPAHTAGRPADARRMAEHTAHAFAEAAPFDAVVAPSGSCAAMVRKVYPSLAKAERGQAAGRPGKAETGRTADLAAQTCELAEFVVRRLGVERLGTGLGGRRVALHHGCHGLRELRLETEARALLEGAGAEVVSWAADRECCGFGGLFATKFPEVSAAMADRKLDTLPDADWLVSGDPGCLLQLEGRSRARGLETKCVHLASALWQGVARGER